MTNVVQHDLQNLFAQTQSGEADRQCRNRSLDRKHGKEVEYLHSFRKRGGNIERVGHAKKSGERRQMRTKRCTKGKESGHTMPGVKMVGGRNLNQFLSPGKFVGQPVKEIEPADDEAGEQSDDRAAQEK